MVTKLKPCPFCQSKAIYNTYDCCDDVMGYLIYHEERIICTGCGATISKTYFADDEDCDRTSDYDSLAKKWNTRVKPKEGT